MRTARIADANRAVGDILNALSSVRHCTRRAGSKDSTSDTFRIQGCEFTLASTRTKRGISQESNRWHELGQSGGRRLRIG